ncbi:MAG TPA: glycosyltransferase 61 family protein [Acetobacteraceae bacterium]|nr:glycosyltransferase 61 family protein [Acetobacteraceae bacterium]
MNTDIQMPWREQLAALDKAGNADQTIHALQIHAFANPADLELQYTLAERLRAQKRFADVDIVLAPLIRGPDEHWRFRALLLRAECWWDRGVIPAAEADISQAASIDPGSHWPVQALAELYGRTGRDDQRIPLIETHYNGLRPDGRAEIVKYASGLQAFWHYDQTRSTPSWRPRCPGRIPALVNAGMILLVKDEDDVIQQNLEHHHALGFRAFYILNNLSSDRTRSKIEAFRGSHADCFVALIDDPVQAHFQGQKMEIYATAFLKHAKLAGISIDWMFYIDADEFICFTGPDDASGIAAFNSVLSDPHKKLLVHHWIHSASTEPLSITPKNYDPFKLFSKFSGRLLPVVPKIAFRTGINLRPMEGNHFVPEFHYAYNDVVTMGLSDWYLAHFSLRSLEHTRKKVINGGKAFQNAQGLEAHGGHWRERYRLYQQHGETIIGQILVGHINSIRANQAEIVTPCKNLPPSSKDATSKTKDINEFHALSLDEAAETLPGISRIKVADTYSSERPELEFVTGAISDELMEEFRRERYVWPVSLFQINNAEVYGPWFEVGSLILRDDISFSCQELYQEGRSDKADLRLNACFNDHKIGARHYIDITDDCVLIATNGHATFGHWLIDFLPKIYLLARCGIALDRVKFLLPSDVGAWARDLLYIVGIEPNQIIDYDQNTTTPRCRNLIVPTLLRMSGRASPLLSDASRLLNSLVTSRLNYSVGEIPKRIYLARGQEHAWRKIENYEILEQTLVKEKFVLVRPETLSIANQIAMMRSADMIVGQHGSALHSTIFCDHPIRSCVLHENVSGWFAGLQAGIAERLDQKIGYVFGCTDFSQGVYRTKYNEDFVQLIR